MRSRLEARSKRNKSKWNLRTQHGYEHRKRQAQQLYYVPDARLVAGNNGGENPVPGLQNEETNELAFIRALKEHRGTSLPWDRRWSGLLGGLLRGGTRVQKVTRS